VLAELANDDDQLLQIGHWAETVAGRLFPVMSPCSVSGSA
jgi:hypothetical protein